MLAFVDSRAAAKAVAAHVPSAQIVTDNPTLANAPECRNRIEDISRYLRQPEGRDLGCAAIDILLELDQRLVADGTCKRSAGYERPINVTLPLRATLATLLHRGVTAARAYDAHQPVGVIVACNDEPRWMPAVPFVPSFYGSPHRSLARHGFFGEPAKTLEITAGTVPANINETSTDSLAIRVASAPLHHVLFHLAERLGVSGLAPGRVVAYGKRCELLDETLPWLAARGHRLIASTPPGYNVSPPTPHDTLVSREDLGQDLEDWLRNRIAGLRVFSDAGVNAVTAVTIDHLAAGLQTLPTTRRAIDAWADSLADRGTRAFLTSGIYGPRGVLVHEALKVRDIPLIDFEHGVTTGIAWTSDRRLDVSEATTCDVLLACSARSKGRFEQSDVPSPPRIEAIGNADQARRLLRPTWQRHLARNRLGLSPSERAVFHVSTFIYGGTARPGDDGPIEAEIYSVDKMLIEQAYAGLDATVLFKPYPVDRFPDEPAYTQIYRVPDNVRILGLEDFRYVRAAADVIVTGANSSTIGWCVACDVPLIHLHSRYCNSLSGDDLIRDFKAGFFAIDMDQPDWSNRLRTLLQRSPSDLLSEWHKKRAAREALFAAALKGPTGLAGRRAAKIVVEEMGRR